MEPLHFTIIMFRRQWADPPASTATTLRRWSPAGPILNSYRRTGDIVDAVVRRFGRDRPGRLSASSKLGSSSQRVVLQALLPKLASLAKTSAKATHRSGNQAAIHYLRIRIVIRPRALGRAKAVTATGQ